MARMRAWLSAVALSAATRSLISWVMTSMAGRPPKTTGLAATSTRTRSRRDEGDALATARRRHLSEGSDHPLADGVSLRRGDEVPHAKPQQIRRIAAAVETGRSAVGEHDATVLVNCDGLRQQIEKGLVASLVSANARAARLPRVVSDPVAMMNVIASVAATSSAVQAMRALRPSLRTHCETNETLRSWPETRRSRAAWASTRNLDRSRMKSTSGLPDTSAKGIPELSSQRRFHSSREPSVRATTTSESTASTIAFSVATFRGVKPAPASSTLDGPAGAEVPDGAGDAERSLGREFGIAIRLHSTPRVAATSRMAQRRVASGHGHSPPRPSRLIGQQPIFAPPPDRQPLAARMRPRTLDEVVGHDHLIGERGPSVGRPNAAASV